MDAQKLRLSDLSIGQSGIITDFDRSYLSNSSLKDIAPDEVVRRIMELGLTLGSQVVVRHFGPIDRSPVAVEVRGGIVALGRDEAAAVRLRITSV
jgi:Fe2+ transport system protein FeoA